MYWHGLRSLVQSIVDSLWRQIMRMSSIQVVALVFLPLCFDTISMLMNSPRTSTRRQLRAEQRGKRIISLKKVKTSPSHITQTPKDTAGMFDLSVFLSKPTVIISGIEYPVFLSDDLKRELNSNARLKQKLAERLQEIQQRDYSKSPIDISNINLYLSDDKKEVYSMAFTEDDW